jgi:hypothetical protein
LKVLKYALILGLTFTSLSCVGDKSKSSKKKNATSPSSSGSVPGTTGNDVQKSIDAFKATVYPMVTTMSCVQCHGDAKAYQPYYAVSDVNAAWQTILIDSKKINLENPESSRIYLRLKNDHHNCLTGGDDTDCDSEAAAMLAAIVKWKDMIKVSTTTDSGIKTATIKYKDLTLTTPDAEFGTLLMEAEQTEFPQAMGGRFIPEADGNASNFSYALTPAAPVNPTTRATRTTVFAKGNACEVTTSTQLADSINGPFQIKEQGTHINSGIRTSDTNLIIKDGQRPFNISVNAAIVRPDKRMAYAKMLTGWSGGVASGTPAITALTSFALAENNFDTGELKLGSTTRDNRNAIDITDRPLTGMMYNDVSFKTLPYFAPRDSVFNSLDSTFINEPANKITNLEGNQIELKNLFKLPQNDITAKDVLKFFERNDNDPAIPNKFRKDLVFKYVKNNLDAIASSTIPYRTIRSMSPTHLYSLYGNLKINITACPGTCTSTTQAVEITPGTDNDGVMLTYANALDILKVNSAGTGFVAGTTAELNAGKAFRRIDVYAHFNVVTAPPAYGQTFDQKFYTFNGSTFDLKSTVSFPINVPDMNLNLKALYANGTTATVTKADSMANFQTTLHPILKNATCMSCHGGSQANRVQFASSNALLAFNEIQRTNLVNFTNPLSSFRKAYFPTEQMIVHNCGSTAECSALQNEMVAAIAQWNTANDSSASQVPSSPFKELTAKERTPGMLEYKFNVKKTGLYNVWTKVKALATNKINLRIMNGSTPVNVTNSIIKPAVTANNCIGYTFEEYTDWKWFTPNRNKELANLSATGKLKKDNLGNLLPIPDGRTYWPLEAGKTYTLQIFEANSLTKIDMIAVDYVASLNDTLDFQPDLLSRDENNIADYQKRVLSYDISNLVGLPSASAYFKVEVKTALGGQNYIFRNPRIISPNANIAVQGIKVYINGATAFTDATWTNLNLTAGDGQIMTFASLLALVPQSPETDYFQFSFDKIAKTTATISELDPRGTAPVLIEGRKCRELDLFLNTVKPILRNARLMLKTDGGINTYLTNFPASGRQAVGNPQIYQCMGCHNDNHPYFKMTTFDYPEILCAQALSRVDFTNYRDSLLVRGLDGSGVHPKLHFIEELQYDATTTTVIPYNENDGARILAGQIKNQATTATPAYFSKWITGYYFNTYTQGDLGLSPTWTANSEAKKALARSYMGQLKRIQYGILPDLATYPFYEPFVHDMLKGKIQTELDNLATGTFNEKTFNLYTTYIPSGMESETVMNNKAIDLNVVKDGTKLRIVGGKKVFNTTETEDEMNNKLEDLKTKYRNVILNWISKEHDHIKNGN